jgi:hypothetical protein
MVNPYDGSYNGGDYDAFVAKLGSDGNALVYSTFLGGADDDWARGIAVDASGQAYVRGRTYSWNFPMVNAYDGSYNGSGDVFAAKLGAAGNSLVYSTFLGGAGLDYGSGIAIDVSGRMYLTGGTRSSNFPTVDAYDGSYNGSGDAFVAKVGQEGNSLVYSTFLGGTYDDEGRGIAVDAFGQAYVTGFTRSDDFPTANAYDATFNGTWDVFAVKFDLQEGPDFCDYFPGDVNHNGMSLELADVVTMINNYRGSLGPAYICDCGVDPPGSHFAATADPNGNCVPFELGDVVTEIGAYRGITEASGCPDCPGSGR